MFRLTIQNKNRISMKKLFSLLVFSVIALTTYGQTVSFTLTTPPCNADGTLTANMTGLTPPLTVQWYAGSFSVTHTGVMTLSDALTGYAGQPVSVYVTDATTSASNYYGGMPPFTYTVSTVSVVCPALGTATATVTGGTAPYTYQWLTNPGGSVVSTANPASLAAGQYNVMITDAAGCTYGSTYSGDSIYLYSSPAFSYSVATTTASCTNGTATVGAITGGLPPYSYLWSTAATSSSISGLMMGSYNVNVTDANGCSVMNYAYVSQSVTISAPTTPTPATCTASDGAITAFGSGGTPPYTYLWSNGATTQSQTGLAAGYYNVLITDANGCIGTGYGNITSSTPITATYTTTASSCTAPTGTATLTLTGGSTPYTINWYTTPPQTGVTASALSPGYYYFNVTDNAGCARDGSVYIAPVDVINLSLSTTPANCTASDGAASVVVSGGVAPLTYHWSTGATASSISGVPTGYYSVNITDVNGCTKSGYANVSDLSPVGLGLSTTPASCIFSADGSIAASVWGGTAPYTYSWSTGGTGSSISGLSTGYYTVYVTDATGCTNHAYTTMTYNPAGTACYCTIEGVVYDDANGNCVQDPGEAGIPGIQIYCSGIGYTYTNALGYYSFQVPTGSYTISETVLGYYPLSACQLNNIPVSVTAMAGCTTPVNFANGVSTIHDIHVSTWDYNFPVPGNLYTQVAVISNEGTVNESGILAGYNSDGQLYAPTFAPSGIFTGSGNWYNSGTSFPALTPGASQSYHITYTVPTDIPMGTSLVYKDTAAYTSPISNWLSDYSPWNNVNYFNSTVVSSYDPNFKEVSPKGTGPQGYISINDSVLEYMVHFQNTGTYKAEKIVVIDTLDPNLDWTSLKPIFESHNCVVTLSTTGVATFTFNGINLPPAVSDATNSNGMFTYTIKQRPGLTSGTQIHNKASIYFDYNEPVVTNSTLNTIEHGVGVPTVNAAAASFSIYPNPADKTCFAVINSDAAGTAAMAITDITGKTVMSNSLNLIQGKQTVTLDVSRLSPGMYFMTLNNSGKIETQKLVIMK